MFSQYIETLPIPAADEPTRKEIASEAEACQRAAEARRDLQQAFRRRIPDLAPGRSAKLPGKLERWWELDFAAFRGEAKKAFKQDIPLADRNDWESWLIAGRAKLQALDAEIARREKAIDHAVYRLFALTPAEIALLEGATG